jgi:DNA mismatch repair protein MutL
MIEENMDGGGNAMEQLQERLASRWRTLLQSLPENLFRKRRCRRWLTSCLPVITQQHPDGKAIITVISEEEIESKLK